VFITGRLILKASSALSKAADLTQWMTMLTAVDAVSRVEQVNSAYRLCHDRYVEFVSHLVPEATVWPVHHVLIRLFLIYMFFKNKMSSASVPNYVSQLKSCQLDKGMLWLDEPGKFAVKKTMKAASG